MVLRHTPPLLNNVQREEKENQTELIGTFEPTSPESETAMYSYIFSNLTLEKPY
jgi:hypothetical protein